MTAETKEEGYPLQFNVNRLAPLERSICTRI